MEPFADKYDCYGMVLYEYRRRTLNGENDRTVSLSRTIPLDAPKVQNLFAVSGTETLTIELYNMSTKIWEYVCEISTASAKIDRNSPYYIGNYLFWDEYFMFCVGGGSTQMNTFMRTVS